MAFGQNHRRDGEYDENETGISETQGYIDLDDDVQQTTTASEGSASGSHSKKLTEENDPIKPLLDEVTLIGAGNSKNAGGAKQWICNHCKGKYTSSYTRIHVHFFGAPLGKKAKIRRCPVVAKDRDTYERLQKRVKDAEKLGVSKSLKSSIVTKRQNLSSKKLLEQSFSIMERSAIDLKIVKALCANGIPFNILRNPQFREMINAIRKASEGYKAPSSEKARTVLLDECVRDVEKDLTPFKDTWYSQGLSIVSDGWTNIKQKPLINVLVVNSRGSMFMYTEDFSGVEKTGKAIAEFLIQAIESVGPSNVLSVVTDNASNCKLAGKEIEKVYKHIFWSPCCVHTLNLIFKDLANEFIWLEDTYKKGKMIVKYFLNHGQALSIFRDNSKLELLKIAKTRFASHYILLKRLNTCREALSTTIALNSWRDWAKQGDEHTRTIAQLVADTIRDDDFWNEVENILKITKPIFLMVKFCNGEGPKMGEIYEKMDNMIGEIKDVMKEILDFMTHFLETLAPGGIRRKAPNLDKEVVQGVMEAFSRIVENRDEERMLREQFATFHMKKGLYSLHATQLDAITMEAIDWFFEVYKEGPHKKWDMDPESTNLESSRIEDMVWEDLEEDEDNDNGKGKKQRVD
ncbi:uncharacterized protein LOC120208863 [Hibiscus syriacus]|uniref:uncharacterized protein LOC120208863 n=1 Tax=Hibiscus syriacus TaxID=106335 RepID=UPI001921E8C5|nr:uncharacterized protein LOC120208863 [Hibiscus syriacus]